MTFLIVEEVNLLRRIFVVGEMRNFLAVGWDSSPSPGFPINVYGDMILRDNPAGHCFY